MRKKIPHFVRDDKGGVRDDKGGVRDDKGGVRDDSSRQAGCSRRSGGILSGYSWMASIPGMQESSGTVSMWVAPSLASS